MKNKFIIIVFIVLFAVISTYAKSAVISKDTTVTLPQIPLINGNKDSSVQVIFPDTSYKYQQILMHYSLSKPAKGWDPYDRIGQFTITKNNQTVEIGRFITPFSKACNWTIDVTCFRPMLADTVQLTAFILYYVTAGSQQGYLVNVSFDFIGGTPKKEAYKIQNLWGNNVLNDRWEYGCYIHPIADSILPKQISIDPNADSVSINVNCTGHGEFNTDNCGEFCEKTHSLRINSTHTFTHNLWRSDCGSNPCSSQSGTWQYDRAGWCPGSAVLPWNVDITPLAKGHNTILIEYLLQQYHNFCSPDDTTCVSNPSADCSQWGGSSCSYINGHTEPFFLIQSQIIYYKNLSFSNGVTENSLQTKVSVFPNPSVDGKFQLLINPVKIETVMNQKLVINIYNALGEKIYTSSELKRKERKLINLYSQPNGIYFINIRTEKQSFTQKISIQK